MNNTFYAPNDYRVYLAHHGIKGQKWGVRRFQNADGSYTSSGKSRYGIGDGESYKGAKASKSNTAGSSSGVKSKSVGRTVGKVVNKAATQYLIDKSRTPAVNNAQFKEFRESKGIGKKMGALFGDRATEINLRVNATADRAMAKQAFTKFGENSYNTSAKNREALADYYKRRQEMTGKQKIKELITQSEYRKVPYTQLNGKTITMGQKMAQEAMAKMMSQAVTYAADEAYKRTAH